MLAFILKCTKSQWSVSKLILIFCCWCVMLVKFIVLFIFCPFHRFCFFSSLSFDLNNVFFCCFYSNIFPSCPGIFACGDHSHWIYTIYFKRICVKLNLFHPILYHKIPLKMRPEQFIGMAEITPFYWFFYLYGSYARRVLLDLLLSFSVKC